MCVVFNGCVTDLRQTFDYDIYIQYRNKVDQARGALGGAKLSPCRIFADHRSFSMSQVFVRQSSYKCMDPVARELFLSVCLESCIGGVGLAWTKIRYLANLQHRNGSFLVPIIERTTPRTTNLYGETYTLPVHVQWPLYLRLLTIDTDSY